MLQSEAGFARSARWISRLAVIASLPGLFLILAEAWHESRDQKARTEDAILSSARDRARAEEQELGFERLILASLGRSPALISSDWRAFGDESARLFSDPRRRLWVFDLSGQLIFDSSQPNGPPTSPAAIPHPLTETVVSAGKPIPCDIKMNAAAGLENRDIFLSLCAPAPAATKTTYILAVAVDQDFLGGLIDRPKAEGISALIDRRGDIIAEHGTKNTPQIGKKLPPDFFSTLGNEDGGLISGPDTEVRTAYAPVGDTGWAVLVEADRGAASSFPLGQPIILALAVSLLVAVIVYGLISRTIRALLTNVETLVSSAIRLQRNAERSDRYRLMAESTVDVIAVTTIDFVGLDVSPACKTMLGYEPEELIGRPIIEIVHPDDAEDGQDLAEEPRDNNRQHISHTIRLRHKDGHYIWVESLQRSFRSAETGETVGYVSSLRDITARKEAEDLATRATQAAEAASRAKSYFLASMSHELRTPLNAILGFSQLLLNNPKMPLNERQREYIEYVIRGGNQLLTLINDLLDFVKTEAGTLRVSIVSVELSDVLDEVVTTLEPLALQKKVTVVLDEEKISGYSVKADRTRLVQVLINLCSNAIKYNHPYGDFIVIVERSRPGWVKIAVKDTGRGIPDSRRDEVFRPFNRLGAEGGPIEGTGIGLTICQRLMAMMGGIIDFTSTPGEGSVFWIELPESFKNDSDAVISLGDQPVDPNPPMPRAVVDENSST